MNTKRLLCVLAVSAALPLAACGDDEEKASDSSAPAATESAPASGGGESLTLTAQEPGEEEYAFDPAELTAKAGKVTIELDNPSSDKAPHTIAIQGEGVDSVSQVAQPGAKVSVTNDLKAGEYTFFCTIGDHRDEGMEGTLTVE